MSKIKKSLAIIFLIFLQNNLTYGADTAAQIKKIFTGTPTPADCLPGVNEFQEVKTSDEQELACLKAGHKKIWWTNKIQNAEELQSLGFGILKYNKFKNYLDHMLIIHAQDALRMALLFEKYFLEKELSIYIAWVHMQKSGDNSLYLREMAEDNPYAMGSFLGYGEKNIPYYYKYNAFQSDFMKNTKNEERGKKFAEFSANSPASLAQKINEWASQNKEWETSFEKDKKNYNSWMKLNKDISNDDLIKQNEAINKAILVLNNPSAIKSETPKKPTSTTPQIKQSQPWWKTVTKYATSFALGTAAAYAILTGTKHQPTTK